MSEKKENTTKNQNKKPNFFVRTGRAIGRGCSNMWAELKKVSWPKFGRVVKQTGVVLGVVFVFLCVITACDFGLQELLSLITKAGK